MHDQVLFGRYRLLEPAGSGGSAQVWRAVDIETDEVVAVKRLHPIVFSDESARRRLERESRALEALEHPNIVAQRELHLEADEAALVLDYVEGESVADRLAAGPPLALGEAVSVVRDVAAALSAAHAIGIVHRDVKPGNIILARDGRALLTDFGIAADDGDAAPGTAALTATGTIVGTFRYMAPELLRGAPASPLSDQYALAAVAYELLAGRPPYAASTPVGLAEAQAHPPEPINGARPDLQAAVLRGLAHDPAERHGDVAAFAAAIGSAVRAAPSAMDTEVAAVVPAGAVAAAAAVVPEDPQIPTGVAAGTPGGTAADAPRHADAAPPVPRRQPRWFPVAAVGALLLAGALVVAAMAGGPDADPAGAAATERAPSTPTPAAETPAPTPAPADDDGDDGDEGGGNGKPDKPDRGKGNGGNGKGKGGD